MLSPGGEAVQFGRRVEGVTKAPLEAASAPHLFSLPADRRPPLSASVRTDPGELGWCSDELIYVVYLLNTINHKLADSFVAIN